MLYEPGPGVIEETWVLEVSLFDYTVESICPLILELPLAFEVALEMILLPPC